MTISAREHIHQRLDKYNDRSRTFAFYAGVFFSTSVALLGVILWTKSNWWWFLGLFVCALTDLVLMGISAHFAEKSRRIRKRLDSIQS